MRRTGILAFCSGLLILALGARASWEPAKRLTWTAGSSSYPAIAVDPLDNLHVVWEEDISGNSEVYYKKSTDGGATWTGAKRLTWTAGDSLQPAIAVDSGGALHVVWMDYTPGNPKIYYRKSSTGGDSWSSSRTLTLTGGAAGSPAIAVDSFDNLHMSWNAATLEGTDIFYKKSTDGGASWTPSQRLTWTPGISRDPALAVGSSANIHVVWEDNAPGNSDIYYRKSGDGGASWSTVRRLTWTAGSSISAVLAVAPSGALHVFWGDDTPGNDEIYAKRSTDGGDNWTANQRLTWISGDSIRPAAAVDSSGNLHLFWADAIFGSYDIYYKKSTNGGATWSTIQRLTLNLGYSSYPAVAVDSFGLLHLVWHDTTPGNGEIFYKKGT
jgi:hypothetical protein